MDLSEISSDFEQNILLLYTYPIYAPPHTYTILRCCVGNKDSIWCVSSLAIPWPSYSLFPDYHQIGCHKEVLSKSLKIKVKYSKKFEERAEVGLKTSPGQISKILLILVQELY